MPEKIVSISTHRRYEKGSKRGRQRVFTMGYHTYSGGPGCCWSANYWIKKINKGKAWELYLSSESALSYKYRLYNGTYSAEHLRDYFESVDFELDEVHWREIGLGRKAEIFLLRPAILDSPRLKNDANISNLIIDEKEQLSKST
jgi:hypothetical protein